MTGKLQMFPGADLPRSQADQVLLVVGKQTDVNKLSDSQVTSVVRGRAGRVSEQAQLGQRPAGPTGRSGESLRLRAGLDSRRSSRVRQISFCLVAALHDVDQHQRDVIVK